LPDEGRVTAPAQLHAREEICLRAHHPQEPRRLRLLCSEDFRIGMEGDGGAPAIGCATEMFERPLRMTAAEALAVELAAARDLDHHPVGKRVHYGDADTVQPAGGFIGLAPELAPRMQGAEDDLERGLVGKARMRIHRNAPTIVAHGYRPVLVQFDLDPGGMARYRLVHRVVEHFGDE